MNKPMPVYIDGTRTVIEVLGTILRQRVPAQQHAKIPSLVDRVSCSLHVGDHLDTVWRELFPAEQNEILREVYGLLATL
jgi:hypothetical protein